MAYPEAQHSGRPYRLEWGEAMLDMQRVYDHLAQVRWFRRTSSQGQFSLATHRYGVGKNPKVYKLPGMETKFVVRIIGTKIKAGKYRNKK